MNATSVQALFQMTRPVNVCIAAAAVLAGYAIDGGDASVMQGIFGPLSAMLITAFANFDNDLAHLAIDRVNRPTRPLPSARVSIRIAIVVSLIVLMLGLLSAQLCGRAALVVSGAAAVWLAVYNRWGKRLPLVGNLMVALAGGLPLVYAGIIASPASGGWRPLWVGFALAAGFHFVREILKDVQDIEGDARAGLVTLPLVLGKRWATRLAAGLLLLASILSTMPGILQWFNKIYLFGSLVLILLPSSYGFLRLWANPVSAEAARWASLTKVMMACGLILLLAGTR